jgi:hypothetical protein
VNIPTIGGARGIFEIFVPGVFLFLNFSIVAYLFPSIDDETRNLFLDGASNPILVLVIVVSFGYLIGILLRLFRTDLPDELSAWLLRRIRRHARKDSGEFNLWARESFPYIGWIGEACNQYCPTEIIDFYNQTWAPRKLEKQNKWFFNHCKIMINSHDERAAAEIYAAEALTRYISGMFFALVFSFFLILITVILRYILFSQLMVWLIIVLMTYIFAIYIILSNFRFVRIKEVETVFSASFSNKSIFAEKTKPQDK